MVSTWGAGSRKWPLLIFMPPHLRTYIYVDGFNLYYRALRNTPYKWLDLKTLFRNLLGPQHDILAINYYTAIVSGKDDPNQPIRQKTFIRAIEKHIPELTVYYGHFLINRIDVRIPNSSPIQLMKVERPSEKGSDVNLAVHVLNDAWLNKYDCAVIVSNDSDLAESLRLVRAQTNKKIGIITPVKYPSVELTRYAHFIKRIRSGVLSISQLPNPIPGTTIFKPPPGNF